MAWKYPNTQKETVKFLANVHRCLCNLPIIRWRGLLCKWPTQQSLIGFNSEEIYPFFKWDHIVLPNLVTLIPALCLTRRPIWRPSCPAYRCPFPLLFCCIPILTQFKVMEWTENGKGHTKAIRFDYKAAAVCIFGIAVQFGIPGFIVQNRNVWCFGKIRLPFGRCDWILYFAPFLESKSDAGLFHWMMNFSPKGLFLLYIFAFLDRFFVWDNDISQLHTKSTKFY